MPTPPEPPATYSQNYVSLSEEVTIFEPMNSINSVFFDSANQQIFTLRSRGAMGVNVKSANSTEAMNFRIEDKGGVLSIKFSPDNKILAIQRTLTTLDLLTFTGGILNAPDGAEYSQGCKNKTAKLLGFVWSAPNELLFVTDSQLELYQVNSVKRCVRLIKQTSLKSDWFSWDVVSHILVTVDPTGVRANAFQLKNPGVMSKLSRFDLPLCLPGSTNQPASEVVSNNCLLATVYGRVFLFIIRKRIEIADTEDPILMNVCMYQLESDGSTRMSDVLLVKSEGPIAISLVDNLILVHSQAKQHTLVYDIFLNGLLENGVLYHRPVLSPDSIAPLNLASNTVPALSSNLGAKIPIELYSTNWIFNLPNIVIDSTLGCLWRLEINHHLVPTLSKKITRVIDFLLNRTDGKSALLEFCSALATQSISLVNNYDSVVEDGYTHEPNGLHKRLDDFAHLFKRLGELHYHRGGGPIGTPRIPRKIADVAKLDEPLVPLFCQPFLIDQKDVFAHVFCVLQGNESKHVRSFIYALLIEYIRSLLDHDLAVEHSLYELLISTIARLEDYVQLTYCIQSRLLEDSKPNALQLLSLEPVYPPAGQLALDMLKRINFSEEDIVEALLLNHHVMEALRFCRKKPKLFLYRHNYLAKRCLEIALHTGDRTILYNVYQFFRAHTDPSLEYNSSFKELMVRIGSIFGDSI